MIFIGAETSNTFFTYGKLVPWIFVPRVQNVHDEAEILEQRPVIIDEI